jgi:hypothetical protein
LTLSQKSSVLADIDIREKIFARPKDEKSTSVDHSNFYYCILSSAQVDTQEYY